MVPQKGKVETIWNNGSDRILKICLIKEKNSAGFTYPKDIGQNIYLYVYLIIVLLKWMNDIVYVFGQISSYSSNAPPCHRISLSDDSDVYRLNSFFIVQNIKQCLRLYIRWCRRAIKHFITPPGGLCSKNATRLNK